MNSTRLCAESSRGAKPVRQYKSSMGGVRCVLLRQCRAPGTRQTSNVTGGRRPCGRLPTPVSDSSLITPLRPHCTHTPSSPRCRGRGIPHTAQPPLADRYHGLVKINGGKNRGSRPTRRDNLTVWTLCMLCLHVTHPDAHELRIYCGDPILAMGESKREMGTWMGKRRTKPRLLGREEGAGLSSE